jgi:hypothetical protein
MAQDGELVTVFRSADPDAEEQVAAVRELLQEAGLTAEVLDDSAPGVPAGAFEVRVPAGEQEEAERLLELEHGEVSGPLDISHDYDMETVFASDAPDAELLVAGIQSILEGQGIPCLTTSGSVFPNLPYEVRVPRVRLEEARSAIAAAEEAGPAAAEEAERLSESEGGEQESV